LDYERLRALVLQSTSILLFNHWASICIYISKFFPTNTSKTFTISILLVYVSFVSLATCYIWHPLETTVVMNIFKLN